MNRTINFTVPEGVWGRLASVAHEQGVNVSELLASAVESLLDNRADPAQEAEVRRGTKGHTLADWQVWRSLVAERHALGMTDSQMAAALARESRDPGWTRHRVGDLRRRMGLPPNKRRK